MTRSEKISLLQAAMYEACLKKALPLIESEIEAHGFEAMPDGQLDKLISNLKITNDTPRKG